MVSVVMLFNELLLGVIGLVTAIAIYPQTSGKALQRSWAVLAIVLSAFLLYYNMQWMYVFREDIASGKMIVSLPLEHFSLRYIIPVVLFLQLYALFPIATQRPGWLTRARGILLCLPALIIACVGFVYGYFNTRYTPLESLSDIRLLWDNRDVMVRLALFAASVIVPTVVFLVPYSKGWISARERPGNAMRFYSLSYGAVIGGYSLLMLSPTGIMFNLFGYLVIVPVIYMNVLHLLGRSPLLPCEAVGKENSVTPSATTQTQPPAPSAEGVQESPVLSELAATLQQFMQTEKPYVDPKCNMQQLLEALQTNENRLNKVLRSEGFSGFREYVNYHRLCYFKEQAAQHKELTVKELMYVSGFTSRSSFYRYFGNMEHVSPTRYLEELRNGNNEMYHMQG